MIETGTYELKTQFFPAVGISLKQYERRKDDLFIWMTNFFDYQIIESKPIMIVIKKVYGEYQPMPRKLPDQDFLNLSKEFDYEQFTIASLGTEFTPNSKSKVAREAIEDFGEKKYGHSSPEWVARKFITPAFDKHGETNDKQIWVDYYDYSPLSNEQVDVWRMILREENIAEDQAANAFYRHSQGENIDKEISFYKKAQSRFKEKYGTIPILVKEWKLKSK